MWGAAAMVTSAPFDDWWHNAYGLDVKIVSPPHTLLAIGIYSIVIGAFLLTLAQQNRAGPRERHRLALLLAGLGGLLLMNFAIFLTEYSERMMQHSPEFYRVSAAVFPFALAAIARAVKLRWPATTAATVYMAMMLSLMWILQLFPATPKLGPIYHHVTNMVTLAFPLWLIIPGIAVDLILHRLDGRTNSVVLGVAIGAAFVVAFMAAQWPFASFLVQSPLSRNWFFNADNYVYWAGPTYVANTHRFPSGPGSFGEVVRGFGPAFIYAAISAFIGLSRGRWMTKVQR